MGYQNIRTRSLTQQEIEVLGREKSNYPAYPDPTVIGQLDNGSLVEVVAENGDRPTFSFFSMSAIL
jgi:hypothetical protein